MRLRLSPMGTRRKSREAALQFLFQDDFLDRDRSEDGAGLEQRFADFSLLYQIDKKARGLAEMMDGKLLLVTNATDLSAVDVIDRYKSLADIERGFKVLKSEIEIGPVYHRLPDRIHDIHCAGIFVVD